MSYTPPLWDSLHFDFTAVLPGLVFDFLTCPYSPPDWDHIDFNFSVVLPGLLFEFAPEIPEPISKELLLSLGVRFSGQVYKYWVCYVRHGRQCVRRYWEHNLDPTPWTSQYQTKFAAGVAAWKNLSQSDKLYWRRVGVRKKEPITSINAFLSAWMKDKVK